MDNNVIDTSSPVIVELGAGSVNKDLLPRIETCSQAELEALIIDNPELGKQALMTMLALSIAINYYNENNITLVTLGSNAKTSLSCPGNYFF